jgi:hypothetical protein
MSEESAYRVLPGDLDTLSLIEFCRDHRAYLQIKTQMMGYEIEIVYRIYVQEEKIYAPTLVHAVQLATFRVLNDMAVNGIWGNYSEEYIPAHLALKYSLMGLESQYQNDSLQERLSKLVVASYTKEDAETEGKQQMVAMKNLFDDPNFKDALREEMMRPSFLSKIKKK